MINVRVAIASLRSCIRLCPGIAVCARIMLFVSCHLSVSSVHHFESEINPIFSAAIYTISLCPSKSLSTLLDPSIAVLLTLHTHIVTSQNTNDLTLSVEMDNQTFVHVLC